MGLENAVLSVWEAHSERLIKKRNKRMVRSASLREVEMELS
jgi:hypothetical protein